MLPEPILFCEFFPQRVLTVVRCEFHSEGCLLHQFSDAQRRHRAFRRKVGGAHVSLVVAPLNPGRRVAMFPGLAVIRHAHWNVSDFQPGY